MRQSAASPLRPLQCQPPIVPRPGPAPCPAVALTGGNLPWHCWGEYPPRHEHTTAISGRAANDPRQHARQRRAVARGVVPPMPPSGGAERRSVARRHAGTNIRPAHGVHCGIIGADARPNWREQAARLSGAGTAPWR
jgi:hypothetical protein